MPGGLALVPPAGFEPAISALKGLRPGPLDDGGNNAKGRPRGGDGPFCAGSGEWIRTTDLRVMSPTSYHCSTPRRSAKYSAQGVETLVARPNDPGTGLFSHSLMTAVSSALERFTAVFGMGTGGSTPLSPPGSFGRDTRGHGRGDGEEKMDPA